jgi:hypothetical protein
MNLIDRRRWKEGFRETFIVLFSRKGDAAALRRLSSLLTELCTLAGPWWPRLKEGDPHALLYAAVRDIRHVRDVLAWIDAGSDRTMQGAALCQFAGHCGEELEKIAAAIEDAMADPQRTLEDMRAFYDAACFVRPHPREVVS